MKIKIKVLNDRIDFPQIIEKGDWIDLRCSKKTTLVGPMKGKDSDKVTFNNTIIPLGVAMQLPDGFEAHVVSRSGTFKHYGVILTNAIGIIDNSYKGDDDEWKANFLAFKKVTIPEGDRICQFRIELSQKATIWQKIKWLFTNKIELVKVDSLNNDSRGGFSSTGVK